MSSARYSKNCAVLGYDAASSGNLLPTFHENLFVPSLGDNNSKKRFLWFLSREYETGRLSRIVGEKLPLLAA